MNEYYLRPHTNFLTGYSCTQYLHLSDCHLVFNTTPLFLSTAWQAHVGKFPGGKFFHWACQMAEAYGIHLKSSYNILHAYCRCILPVFIQRIGFHMSAAWRVLTLDKDPAILNALLSRGPCFPRPSYRWVTSRCISLLQWCVFERGDFR